MDRQHFCQQITSKAWQFLTLPDVLGRVVISKDLGTINAGEARQFIDVSKLTSGAYMFTLSSASFRSTGKVVIK